MAKNIELLKRLRTRLLRMRHSQHFNMKYIAVQNECGTAMCIAGHALDLEGYKVKFDGLGNASWLTPSGGRIRTTAMRKAARLLGMAYYGEAYLLFHDFSLKTPKQAAKRIEQIIAEAEAA